MKRKRGSVSLSLAFCVLYTEHIEITNIESHTLEAMRLRYRSRLASLSTLEI